MWVHADSEGRSGVRARPGEGFGGGLSGLGTLLPYSGPAQRLVGIHPPTRMFRVTRSGDLPWHGMGLGKRKWETPERGWQWPATMPAVGQLPESCLPRRLPQDAAVKGSLAALPLPPSRHSPEANMVSLRPKNLSLLFPSFLRTQGRPWNHLLWA